MSDQEQFQIGDLVYVSALSASETIRLFEVKDTNEAYDAYLAIRHNFEANYRDFKNETSAVVVNDFFRGNTVHMRFVHVMIDGIIYEVFPRNLIRLDECQCQ